MSPYEPFDSYACRFKHVMMERSDGVLTMTLHSDGGSLRWGLDAHAELAQIYRVIAADPENRCIILTGAGEEFIGPRAVGSSGSFTDNPAPYKWDLSGHDARRMNFDMLEVPVPMIAAVNGPCYRHGNMPLMCDIVIASETATWEDKAHYAEQNLVPGDGVHIIYPLLMGQNRARYFMLTGEVIDAHEAKRIGMVNEVLPPDQVLPRARELAAFIAEKPAMLSRATRHILTQTLRRDMHDLFTFGNALEHFVGKASDARRPELDAKAAGEFG